MIPVIEGKTIDSYYLQQVMDVPGSHEQSNVIPRRVSNALEAEGFQVDSIGVVHFTADSPKHPRRWSFIRKVYDTGLICFLEFFTTLISNTGTSIAPFAAEDLRVGRQTAVFCLTTVYLVGQAIGGLIFPPIAESFGGRTIYLTSTFLFAVFSSIVAARPTLPVVVTSRFVTGLLSAMPSVVAAGSIENIWNMKSRMFTIHVWCAGAVVGLALGPPTATYVSTSKLRWPWVFVISAIVTGIAAILCLAMQESRPSKVLRQQVRAVAQQENFDGLSVDGDASLPTVRIFIKKSLLLPGRLFFTEPIVFLTSLMAATVYSIVYLFSEAIEIVYVDGFGFSSRQSSLVMLAIAVGVIFTFLPRLYDVRVASQRRRQGKVLQPEDKLFGFFVAAPILAAGLWWFACTVPPLANAILPWAPISISSLVLVGFSVVEFDNVLSGYLCDIYAAYTASANAPMAFLRAILSGMFPLFGRQLFLNVGSNNALFILAGVATLYCGIAVLFWLYGKQIRGRNSMAEETWAAAPSSSTNLPDAVYLVQT